MFGAPLAGYAAASCLASALTASCDLYLTWRQLRATRTAIPPAVRAMGIDDAKYADTQRYTRAKLRFQITRAVFDAVVGVVSLRLRVLPAMWYATATISGQPVGSFLHCVAAGAASELLSAVVETPWAAYHAFVLEARFGFNRTTRREFIRDTLVTLALKAFVLQPVVTLAVNGTVRAFGTRFPVYLFGAGTALVLGFTIVYPALIQPLFNKFTAVPPERAALLAGIQAMATDLSFPLTKVFVVDGSRRSSHSNAYFFGFFKNKRVVLFDTLLSSLDDEQVLAVLAHEFGHWYHGHTLSMFGAGLGQLGAICYLARLVLFDPAVYGDFGYRAGDLTPVVGFALFSALFEPVSTVLHMLLSAVSRRFEFQADRFAVARGHGPSLRSGLLAMQRENLISLTPDWLFAACHYSHPPLPTRIAAIDELVAASQKKAE